MKKILINFVIFLMPFIAFASSENLIKAIKSNNLSAVKLEISADAELNKKFDIAEVDEETTPLILASYYGYIDIVKTLVENGADVFARNSLLDSALTIAKSRGHEKIVNYLIPFFKEVRYDFFGSSEEIEWADSLEDGIELLKEEENKDKYVMVVFIRIGCKWSKKMGEDSFQDELIVRSINKSFIPILMDKEIDEYEVDKFSVKYTPTIFFINKDGEVKYKIFGFRDRNKFSQEIRRLIEREKKKRSD